MFHEFMLLERARIVRDFDYPLAPLAGTEALRVHDEVLGLLGQSLGFIPTFNPSRGDVPQHGLNLAGLTFIHGDGAAVAARVFAAWADLYAAAPPRFARVGDGFSTVELDEQSLVDWPPQDIGVGTRQHRVEDDLGNGHVHLELDRDALVAVLRQLAGWCTRAAADTRLCVLHLGL